jgi:DNA invertase Pin-like site-specific DNA recombinase
MMKPKRAVSYARFSNPKLQDVTSIDDQFLVCEKIAARNGFEIVKRFRDDGISGTGSLERDGWLALMRAAKAGEFEAVIVESLSRMSRDLADSAGFFKRLDALEIQLVDLEGAATTMRVGLSGIMNQEFVKHLGNQLRRKWDGCVTKGQTPGKPAYGYRLVAGKTLEREIDPQTAAIVVRIFTEYVNGVALREIAARLNNEGIPSPSGGKWNHAVITAGNGNGKGIIGNRIYIGELVWNQYRSIKGENEKRTKRKGKPEDLITAPVPHLRIVDQALWDRAQRMRTGRSRQIPGRVYKKTIMNHMLAGRLFCGACGGRMKIVWSGAREGTRVGCGNARDRAICTNAKSYSLPEIEATVLHGVKHNLDVEALMAFTEGAHKEWAARQRAASVERHAVERALNRAVEKIDRIIAAITDTDAEVKPLAEKLKTLELERAGLQVRLENLQAEGNVVTLLPETIRQFRLNLERLHDALSAELTDEKASPYRVAFGNVFDRVVVHPTGKRRPVEATPYVRLSAIMGADFFPRMRKPQEVFGKTLDLATQGTLKQLGW